MLFDAISNMAKGLAAISRELNAKDDDHAGFPPAPDIHVEVKAGQAGEPIPMTCPKCGASIRVPAGGNPCYCMYCGTQLHVNDGTAKVVYQSIDQARISEAEAKKELELKRLELQEKQRPGRLKLMAFLAVLGVLMLVIGQFAGHASGDSNSPWYMVGILGFFPLLAIPFIWFAMNGYWRQ